MESIIRTPLSRPWKNDVLEDDPFLLGWWLIFRGDVYVNFQAIRRFFTSFPACSGAPGPHSTAGEVTVLDDKEVRRRFRASNYQSTTRQRSHRMLECWFFFTRRSGLNQHVIYAKSTPIFCNEVQKFNSRLFNIHIYIYHFLNNCLMIWVVTCWGSSRFPATWLQLWSTSHVQTSGWSRSFVPCRCD